MRFQFFDQVIGNHNIDLDCLRPDTNPYTTLLLQHKGMFHADNSKFGNRDDATGIFTAFLQLAQREQASIAVTPEYSCPWNAISWIISSSANQPGQSKLWALGCESITPAELRLLRETHQSDQVLIHFDDSALDSGVNTLLDPLCYVFNTTHNETGAPILVLLVQFKTAHMGVWTSDLEREMYIPGTEVYVLRNDAGSIALFTIICSETDNFNISPNFEQELDHRWSTNSFIILNIQMNPQPSASSFKIFRKKILNYTNKDIISLNWACENVKRDGGRLIPYSKSSIAFESPDMEFADEEKFRRNHSRGLYYTNRQQKRHTYFLDGSQHVFLIGHHKPISGGPNPSMLIRTGPTARENYSWNPVSSTFVVAPPLNDGFIGFLGENGCTNPVMHDTQISFIDKERLLNISTGNIKVKPADRIWHPIDKLTSFFLDDDEIIRRLTFIQDPSGDDTRRIYLDKIDTLHNIITSRPDLFPKAYSPFPGNCDGVVLDPTGTFNLRYNLITRDGKHKATVAYIGRNTLDNAYKVFNLLRELYDGPNQATKLIIVWYKPEVDTIVPVCDPKPARVNDDDKPKPNAITRQP